MIRTFLLLSTLFFSMTSAATSLVLSAIGGRSEMDLHSGEELLTLNSKSTFPAGSNAYLEPQEQPHADMWGGFIGIEEYFNKYALVQIGVGYYQNQTSNARGAIYYFGFSENHNADYQVSLKHQRLMGELKWMFPVSKYVYPYLWGGAGVAWNKIYDYDHISLIPSDVAGVLFHDHSERDFAYGFGGGLEIPLIEHLRLGLGYQYVDAGEAKVSPSDQQNTDEVITYDHFSGSVWLAELSVLFY